MKMGAGHPTGHADRAQRLAAGDELAFRHRDRLEVEVRGVEPEPVVEDHESTGKEELGRQRDATAVRGDDCFSMACFI